MAETMLGNVGDACGPDCRYRALYEGTQASLTDMAGRQAAALGRVGRLRNGVLNALRTAAPGLFAQLESRTGRLADADDQMVVAAVEHLLRHATETTPGSPALFASLRHALNLRGVVVVGDDPTKWLVQLSSAAAAGAAFGSRVGNDSEQIARAAGVRAELSLWDQAVGDVVQGRDGWWTLRDTTPKTEGLKKETDVVTTTLTAAADSKAMPRKQSGKPVMTSDSGSAVDTQLPASAVTPGHSHSTNPEDVRPSATGQGPTEPGAGVQQEVAHETEIAPADLPADTNSRANPEVTTDDTDNETDGWLTIEQAENDPVALTPGADALYDDDIDDVTTFDPSDIGLGDQWSTTGETDPDDFGDFGDLDGTGDGDASEDTAEQSGVVAQHRDVPSSDGETTTAVAPARAFSADSEPAGEAFAEATWTDAGTPTEESPVVPETARGAAPDSAAATSGLEDSTHRAADPASAGARDDNQSGISEVAVPGSGSNVGPEEGPGLASLEPISPEVVRKVAPTAPVRVELFPQQTPGRAKKRRKPKVSALGPEPVTGGQTDSAGGAPDRFAQLDALVRCARPVFLNDLVQTVGESDTVDAWFEQRRSDGSEIRFIAPKTRHRHRGALVVPVGSARADLDAAQPGVWSTVLDRFRGAKLFETAVVLWHCGRDIVSYRLSPDADVLVLRTKLENALTGVVVVADESATGITALTGAVEGLLTDPLDRIVILATAERALDDIVENLGRAGSERSWAPPCPVIAARSWEWVDAGGPTIPILG